MKHHLYLLLQLKAINEFKYCIEAKLNKKIDRNKLMLHWCKRYASSFRKFTEDKDNWIRK